MKKQILTGVVLAGALFLQIPAAHAQAAAPEQTGNQAQLDKDVSLLRQDLRSQKKQLIAANLTLTADEATKFWPVYDQYAAELQKLGDQKYALIKEYAQSYNTMTDEQALSLAKRSLALDEQVAALRAKYLPLVNKVIPGKKAATFFQLDRRVSLLMDLQLASEIPLVQK
ncbi:MAG TPA: hypothetical protein VMH31_12390 [Methylomirabilota bacterium]|nr:hypothetical protein [Methylomirabilota bacterium]